MHFHAPWTPDPTRVLTRRELAHVLADARKKARRSANGRRNLAILRLACCCGPRVSEIAQLQMGDLVLDGPRPHLRLRSATTKGKRGRVVPLWWDAGTLADLRAWIAERRQMGAGGRNFAICSLQANCRGEGLKRHAIRRRFLSACKALGTARLKTLTIHHGRHTFISHALAGGRTLAEVRAAAGHASVAMTSVYLHVVIDDDLEQIGSLFG